MYLKLDNLTKNFGLLKAVDHVNLAVNKGELLSLLGPSGCGKTTTLKMIGGFLEPDNGRVILEGQDITALPPEARPVATVFQSYALFPHMSVIENVTYGLKYRKELNKKESLIKGQEMLAIVGMEQLARQNVTRLSGGQQQRVALARALILNPRVLLLDEPFSNLDAKLRVRMRQEIKDIQKRFNVTMVFVTHDQEEALSISDRVVVMNEGKVQQIGLPEEIYREPVNQFVADFIGKANIIDNPRLSFIVRPEHIVLDKETGEKRGRIIQKHFQGPLTTYFIESENAIFQACVLNSSQGKEWDLDEEVYFSFLKNHKLSI
jgi:iron(III) transport system ATP-binding protein